MSEKQALARAKRTWGDIGRIHQHYDSFLVGINAFNIGMWIKGIGNNWYEAFANFESNKNEISINI